MNYILFDGVVRNSLLPFTYTRPVAEIRIGILTIKEKWENYLGVTVTILTEEYLEEKYPMVEMEENVFINASILPTLSLVEEIEFISEKEALLKNEEMIAFYAHSMQEEVDFDTYELKEYAGEYLQIETLPAIFTKNDSALRQDFELLTKGKTSQEISSTNQVSFPENVFIEEGAVVEFAILNASTGPIYIGKDALVMEGSMVRGPFSLGEKSVLKMGTKIYGATTIGPNCTVGGEVKNAVFFGNSNKGHDGYLGNSVIGEWCNLGADTNCSNMKNNHNEVKLWNYESETYENTGLQFCGLFLGDHSKTGINAMFNTGTVVGVSCNVYGAGFPEKMIPSFSWGAVKNISEFEISKAKETAKNMCKLKKSEFTEVDELIFEALFQNEN